MGKSKYRTSILYGFLAVLFFVMLNPCYVWGYEWPRKALIVFSGIMLVVSMSKDFKMPNPLLIFILLFLCCFMVSFENPLSFTIFLLLIFLLIPNKKKQLIYHYIIRLYAAFMVVSILAYLLVVWLGVNLPSHYIAASNQFKEYDYTQYPFLVIPNDFKHPDGLFRFHSVFDEPGVVGTLAGLFLWIERYKIGKWYNLVVFISGVLSFSLFFIIISTFYFMVVFKDVVFRLKNLFYLCVVVLSLTVAYFSLKERTEIDAVVDALVLSRFETDSNKGDNRSTDTFDAAYEKFLASGDGLMFGKGSSAHVKIDPAVQSYKMMIYDYGIVFVFFSLFFFLYHGYLIYGKKTKLQYFLYLVFLLGFYYQRPAFLLAPAYFFLFLVIPLGTNEEGIVVKTKTVKMHEKKDTRFLCVE